MLSEVVDGKTVAESPNWNLDIVSTTTDTTTFESDGREVIRETRWYLVAFTTSSLVRS